MNDSLVLIKVNLNYYKFQGSLDYFLRLRMKSSMALIHSVALSI